jgi:hypothetical protein
MSSTTPQKFWLSPEQGQCLADPNGPADVAGAYLVVRDMFHVRERALENFRTGQGMEWGEHQPCCFKAPNVFSGQLQHEPPDIVAPCARRSGRHVEAGRSRR